MKKNHYHYITLFLSAVILNLMIPEFSQGKSKPIEDIQELIETQDFIGARILIKNLFREEFNFGFWREVRKLVYEEPRVGYDLIFALEQHPVKKSFFDKDETLVNSLADKGDQLMLLHQYSEALTAYKEAANKVKTLYKNKVPKENQQFYFYLLHQMARALFSTKNYKPALMVYNYLPKSYYQARQVQFEKMWTTFYLNQMDLSIGSIVSQRSPYFSLFLEPEAYIVQLYVFRKLCRYQESNATIKEIKFLEDLIKNQKLSLKQWAKMDIETMSIFNLLESRDSENRNYALVAESLRKKERQLIKETLQKKYQQDLVRLQKGYTKILNFSILSKKVTTKSLGKINNLPSPKNLYLAGLEYWPKEDAEDWLDEFGTYYFIGETNCKTK